jgi:hypothetical protein
MASSVSNDSPACASSVRSVGISVADACAPPGPLCCQRAVPCCTAMLSVSVLVSKASSFMA